MKKIEKKKTNSKKIKTTNEKLKKLKKQTYIALAIFILSLAVISFITNFY